MRWESLSESIKSRREREEKLNNYNLDERNNNFEAINFIIINNIII